MDGDEVAQVYVQYPQLDRMPHKELKNFARVHVKKDGKETVRLAIPLTELQKWDLRDRKWKLYPGNYKLIIGSHSNDAKLLADITIKSGLR